MAGKHRENGRPPGPGGGGTRHNRPQQMGEKEAEAPALAAGATLRIVVRFAERRAEATVDAERPVAQLLPELLAAVFGAEDAATASQLEWTLRRSGGAPLLTSISLRDLEVGDGSVLELKQADRWPGAPALPAGRLRDLDVADLGLPRQRTLAVLPPRQGATLRLAGAFGALVSREPAPPTVPLTVPAPGAYVPPGQLTMPRRPTALARSRERWRTSAYEHRLEWMIQVPQLTRCATIAVMSPKGGVGKTT